MKQARLFALASLSTIGLLLSSCGSLVDNDHRFEVFYENKSAGYNPPEVVYWLNGRLVGNLRFARGDTNQTPVDKTDTSGRSFNRIVYGSNVCLDFVGTPYKYKFIEPAHRYSTAGYVFDMQMDGDTITSVVPSNDPNGEAKLVTSCP